MNGTDRRFYEIERRLRDLDVKTARQEDASQEERQWLMTIPLNGQTFPVPPPPPPSATSPCCASPTPLTLYLDAPSAGTSNQVLTWSLTGNPYGVWFGIRPVAAGFRHEYAMICAYDSGSATYRWFFRVRVLDSSNILYYDEGVFADVGSVTCGASFSASFTTAGSFGVVTISYAP